ncbi:MAG: hypothetical protein KAR19_13340 [Bacteroidales bacterium]|nr:hypothetical protein [Bacteroidales bacterium]
MKTMNYLLNTVCKVAMIILLSGSSFLCMAQSSYTLWEQNFQNALKSADVELIKEFFLEDFSKQEIESWKYELRRGHLNFNKSRIIRVNTNTVLMYIPTNNNPYDGDNHNEYFDFIYRVYKIETKSGNYLFTERLMENIRPDFINYKLDVNVEPEAETFYFDCNITLKLKTPHLIFKLAKNFEITSFKLNGSKVDYERFGYLIHCISDATETCQLHIKGSLKAPGTNNQFISMNNNCFFIRFGGFAAIPSPPPGNSGRNHFSDDSTHFEITYTYPVGFTILQYGNSTDSLLSDGRMQTNTTLNGAWMDNIAFYAQNNWDKKEIMNGDTYIGFYFSNADKKERDYIIAEVDTLLQWINTKFDNCGKFSINFVVLDNFVKGGLLNDSYSIVAQNAKIIGSGGIGYLHEICHSAPQPSVDGNYLWIKEGFTNFLAFEYLQAQKEYNNLWKNKKRKYLHCFDLYEEPLINITSTSIPTYWAAYQKGPWVYRMLESVIGKENFQKVLYKLGEMDDVELSNNRDYMNIFEEISGQNLKEFEEQWLYRKENPVLNVQGQLETIGENGLVKIKITQKEPVFKIPMEVEIKTENNCFRRVINVEGKETIFEMPVKGKKVAIEYDPDSRLFAIIKDHKKTFTEEVCDFNLPKDTICYISEDGNDKLQLWFSKSRKGISIHKKTGNSESCIELTNKLSPVCYIANGDTVFNQNIQNKTINFKNERFDIAEPVYPKEFIPFLFSIIDWNDIDELSLLYLIPDSKDCQVIFCKGEKNSTRGFELIMEYPLSDDKIKIVSIDGVPQVFTTLDGRKFTIE